MSLTKKLTEGGDNNFGAVSTKGSEQVCLSQCPKMLELNEFHWEIKGRFRERVVLAKRTLVPVFVPGEHPPKPPFWKPPRRVTGR